ncbi:MAG: shikimate kinase [Neisseria sp.]|nr:shikimate kinase [Neisseria sp.]
MPVMKMTGNFFLIGLPGAGKTTLGKLLAQKVGYTFVDADQYLSERTGVTIPTIFELEGEAGFRAREAAVIDELTQQNRIVLATGGGAVLNLHNRMHLRQRGQVVYLHAGPQVLHERTRSDRNRPLLQVEDPVQKLHELYAVRDPFYREIADYIIEVEGQSCVQAAHSLFSALNLP